MDAHSESSEVECDGPQCVMCLRPGANCRFFCCDLHVCCRPPLRNYINTCTTKASKAEAATVRDTEPDTLRERARPFGTDVTQSRSTRLELARDAKRRAQKIENADYHDSLSESTDTEQEMNIRQFRTFKDQEVGMCASDADRVFIDIFEAEHGRAPDLNQFVDTIWYATGKSRKKKVFL